MSTILRYAKHLRRLNGVGWRVVLNQPQIEVTGVKLRFSQTHLVDLTPTKSYATHAETNRKERLNYHNETPLHALELRSARHGRVSKNEILKALSDAQYSGIMSSMDALVLIRCCGRVFFEGDNEESIQLVQDIWDTCTQLKTPIDVSHYNALLNVYLEKDHTFSPSSFITEMLEKSVEPNRVTYQRLIMAYCKQGNIAGAAKLLEIMKDKNMPLCESIFNSLIIGHSQAGDIQSAIKILETMEKTGIAPSPDTYEALMCAHAKHGDIQSIEATLEESNKLQGFSTDARLLEVFYTLVANGHVDLAEKFAEAHLGRVKWDSDIGRILVKLVKDQQIPLAIKLLKITTAEEPQLISRSAHILRTAVKSPHLTGDDLVQICKELETNGYSNYAFQTSIYHGYKSECKPETIMMLLKAWKDQGAEIRIHYFWPLLRLYTKENSYEGVMKVLRTMIDEFKLIPCVETLQDYVIPYIFGTWQDAITILSDLEIPKENIYFAILKRLLLEKKIRNAGMFMNAYPTKYPKEMFLDMLVEGFLLRQRPQTFLDALRCLDRDPDAADNKVPIELIDETVLKIIDIFPEYKPDPLVQLIRLLVENGLSISPKVGDEVRSFLKNNVTPEVDKLLEKLTSGTLTQMPVSESTPHKYTTTTETEESTKVKQLRHSFYMYLSFGDAQKLLDVLEQIKVADQHSAAMLAQALSYFCNTGNLEAAEKCVNKQKEWGVKLDNLKIIGYMRLLVKNERSDDAIMYLSDQPDAEIINVKSQSLKRAIRELLEDYVKARDVENLSKMFNALQSKNFIEASPDKFLTAPLIRVHMEKGDFESALEEFERVCITHKCSPLHGALCKQFIEMENANALQKITDLATEIHGERAALIELAFTFLQCNRPRQAQKIFETSGMQLHIDRMERIIEWFHSKNEMQILDQLPKITRRVVQMDHGAMYNKLLDVYDQNNDWERGLGLWTEMQESDVHPRPDFLPKLHKLLVRNGQNVPFVLENIPSLKDSMRAISTINSSVTPYQTQRSRNNNSRQFEEALLRQDYDLAEDIIKLQERSKSQKFTMYYDLAKCAFQNNNIDKALDIMKNSIQTYSHMSRRLFAKVANEIKDDAGLKKFEDLGEIMEANVREFLNYSKRLTSIRIRVHGLKHFLENLNKRMSNSTILETDLHFGAMVKGLLADPSALPLMEEVAHKLSRQGMPRPLHVLWNYFYIIGSPKAEKLWREYISKSNSPLIDPLIDHAIENQDPHFIEHLIALMDSPAISLRSKGKLYTALMRIHNALGNYEESLKVFQRTQHQLNSNVFPRDVLRDINTGLRKSGKEMSTTGIKGMETAMERMDDKDSNAAELQSESVV